MSHPDAGYGGHAPAEAIPIREVARVQGRLPKEHLRRVSENHEGHIERLTATNGQSAFSERVHQPRNRNNQPARAIFWPFLGIKRPRRHELFRVHSVINGPFAFIQRVSLFWNHVCILLKWCFCPFLLLTLLAPVLSVTMSLRRPARDPGGQGAATGAHGRGATGRGDRARGAATKRRNARLTAFWVRAAQL